MGQVSVDRINGINNEVGVTIAGNQQSVQGQIVPTLSMSCDLVAVVDLP